MAITLYDALIPSFQQILGAVSGLLAKAKAHCAEKGVAEAEIIGARLYEDMLPFAYQVKSCAEHSLGAIEGVRKGQYSPDLKPPPDSFAALNEKIDAAKAALTAIDPLEINGFEGQDMCFVFGERRMDFTAEDFLLSFSQPNFYFHASIAYGVLRMKGVELGKRDFMGMPRIKR